MKKIISVLIALSVILSSVSVFANSITLVTDRGTAYSKADFGEMPLKRYATIADSVVKEHRASYTFEKTDLNVKIETDIKEEADAVLLNYDKDGKLSGVKEIKVKDTTTFKLTEEIARLKGFAWVDGKLVSLGDSDETKPTFLNESTSGRKISEPSALAYSYSASA